MVNTLSFTERKRVRKNFGKLREVSKFPNLIEIQKKSYEDFLLEHSNPSERPDKGLQKVFKSVFPLEDFSGSSLKPLPRSSHPHSRMNGFGFHHRTQ